MARRLQLILALVVLLTTAQLAADWGQEDPRHWLQLMSDAAQSVTFSGELVYGQGDHLVALQVVRVHQEPGKFRERIYSLSGASREILRDAGTMTRITPAERAIMVDHTEIRRRITDLTEEQIRSLDSWYSMMIVGEDRVADRSALVIRVKPEDDYRYAYVFWICRQTGLLLRSQMMDAEGDILEQFMFVSIRIDDAAEAEVEPTLDHEGFRRIEVEPAREPEDAGQWSVNSLPGGYQLLGEGWRNMHGMRKPVRHLIYGDGLGSVSIYVSPDTGKPFHGQSGRGAMHVAGRIVGDYQVTVVGDVPKPAVRRILEGLEYQP